MDADTLKALRGSIFKWWLIVNGLGEDRGWANCDLCHRFFRRPLDGTNLGEFVGDCDGCPVMAASGQRCCVNTPYDHVKDDEEYSADHVEMAQLELAFLRSLLPPGETE